MDKKNSNDNLIEVKAKLRYLRQSPRKVRPVADLIRHLPVDDALHQLSFSTKRAARPLFKLLQSAIANAENNNQLKKDNLFIKEIRVDQGPALKRWRARAMGRAAAIRKRTSHIFIVLAEIKSTVQKNKFQVGSQKSIKDKNNKKSEVKVINSLDEIKANMNTQHKFESDEQIEAITKGKNKGPATAKRKFFSRKSG